jgi:FKBP12-rapamycin complex-associated protein
MYRLRALFVALNDESGKVRSLAIGVVGRLASLNPAYILPFARKHLMQLLNDMELSPDSKQREGLHHMLITSHYGPVLMSIQSSLSLLH